MKLPSQGLSLGGRLDILAHRNLAALRLALDVWENARFQKRSWDVCQRIIIQFDIMSVLTTEARYHSLYIENVTYKVRCCYLLNMMLQARCNSIFPGR